MLEKVFCFVLALVLVFSLVACSTDTPANIGEVEASKNSVATEGTIVTEEPVQVESQTPDDLELYKQFDLLKIEREENSIENGFVQAVFVIQNKSDSLTISNFTFEYLVDNGSGTPLDESFSTDEYDGLFTLGPRQKAELDLREYIGSKINEDMRIFISSYSYDLNGNRYVVDIIEQSVLVSDINNQSNVSYNEKHILRFEDIDVQSNNQSDFINTGEADIKVLEVSVAVYDEHNVMLGIQTVTVVASGEKPIASNKGGSVQLNQIYTRDNGYLLPVRYAYGTGNADEQGYNFFEINLITGEAIGSTNIMLMDDIFEMSADELKKEIELYTSAFGKKITDTSFEGYEIEERVGSEWLHFYNTTLFGVQGIATLVRDYDTLIITDFWFSVENHDETTAAYLLKALELIYGEEYESETENGQLKRAEWDLGDYSVEYDAKSGRIHIDSDIE